MGCLLLILPEIKCAIKTTLRYNVFSAILDHKNNIVLIYKIQPDDEV